MQYWLDTLEIVWIFIEASWTLILPIALFVMFLATPILVTLQDRKDMKKIYKAK